MRNIFRIIHDNIRHPYYYVPPCPQCGSRMTGRYVKTHRNTTTDWVINDSLKHGELVKPLPELPIYKNSFCVECGHEWNASIRLIFPTNKQIMLEKEERRTIDILASRYDELRREERVSKKRGGILGIIPRYIGKI